MLATILMWTLVGLYGLQTVVSLVTGKFGLAVFTTLVAFAVLHIGGVI